MQNKDQILEKETNNREREREREHLNKKDLFHKLSKLSSKQIKDIGLTNKDIDYLKNKILNDKLGLVLNYEEHDEFFENHYFGLEEVKDLHINPKDKNNHLLIEGDNYYALKALLASGIKVDVIYIDPPYNTGNKDFVYNDSFVEKDDQFKHSKWLSFMKNRLELARELLADDGVIFVSIDDNEQAYLKVLMDEIFGEENFICNFVRHTRSGGGYSNSKIGVNFDYILTYQKTQIVIINERLKNIKELKQFSQIDEYGRKYKLRDFIKTSGDWRREDRPTMFYEIEVNGIKVFPKRNGVDGRWIFGYEKYLNMKKNELIVLKEKDGEYLVKYKEYPNSTTKIESLILDNHLNQKGTLEIDKILLKKDIFNNPKPISLISYLVNMISKKNSTILDFFAGSGTTAQAVMELNEEDGGNRRFILCTNNENNIATDICRERIYRVINGKGSKNEIIDWKYSDDKKSLDNNSMKYLRVKPIHKINGNYEDINDMEPIYVDEFDKDYISIKDFK